MLASTVAVVIAALCLSSNAATQLWSANPHEAAVGSGTMLTWNRDNVTFVFLQFPIDDVRVTVDATRHAGKLDTLSLPGQQPLAVVSGGTWSNRKQGLPISEGLVISSGKLISPRHSQWSRSGLLIHRGPRPEVVLRAELGKKDQVAEALEVKRVLLHRGSVNSKLQGVVEADWIAIGTSDEALVVAAVIHQGERFVTLPNFAEFIFNTAKIRQLTNLTIINLDGACATQLYIPSLDRLFSCSSVSFTPNRILIWRRDGITTRR
jgi:hypothetical protein